MSTAVADMHLVEDDVVTVPGYGEDIAYRVRLWMDVGSPAVLLIDRPAGRPASTKGTMALLKHMKDGLLKHWEGMTLVFETNGEQYQRVILNCGRIRFNGMKPAARMPSSRSEVETAIGGPLE